MGVHQVAVPGQVGAAQLAIDVIVGPILGIELDLGELGLALGMGFAEQVRFQRAEQPAEIELHLARLVAVAEQEHAAIDPDLVKQTKRALNKSFEMRGLTEALDAALDIDLQIEGGGSPDKIQFMEIARSQGLKAALSWRDSRFPGRS